MPPDDWDPEIYARFVDMRCQPARDLLARVGDLPPGPVVDLGCGTGAMGADLVRHFPGRALIGLDAAPTMLAAAREGGAYRDLVEADMATWAPEVSPALIFSNAALQWLAGHDDLMVRLAGLLVPGGVLAVQMPRQWGAPSHRFLRDIAASLFPDRFPLAEVSPVGTATHYWQLLAPLGKVSAWETDYIHRIEPQGEGHPVRHLTEGTVMRPFLARLDDGEAKVFRAAYDAALKSAYPALDDGGVLLPFRRVFFHLQVG